MFSSPDIHQTSLLGVLEINNCGPKCALSVHGLTLSDVFQAKMHFCAMSALQQKQWLLEYLHTNTRKDQGTDISTMFFLQGKEVCLRVWLTILGITKTAYYNVRQLYLSGVQRIQELEFFRMQSPKTLKAIAWMSNYFKKVGDMMPDRMVTHLPSCLTLQGIYDHMKEELEQDTKDVISKSQFYKVWKLYFSNVLIPKVRSFRSVTIIRDSVNLGLPDKQMVTTSQAFRHSHVSC